MVNYFVYFVLVVSVSGWVVVVSTYAGFDNGALGVFVVCSRGGVVEDDGPVFV